ncbi:zinc-dependent alcohol dehydrogenase family protein [Mucilaginibacter angelicae]|uniref:enoyl-[acyl-carrier-protein] reductase n=1 Tax=Mucilaginibacter angelicae TaxID=869718 RepID=A0ABV6LFC5_9SPHI
MKALVFEQAGNAADVIQLKHLAYPKPGPGQLLIRVKASPIHPADLLFIDGKYRYQPVLPQIAGLEGAGYVEEAGHDSIIPKGSLVAFSKIGAWAQYVVVDEQDVVLLPDAFPIEKAAQLLLNPYTAYGLIQEAKVKSGDWLLLTAGHSTVSRIVIQLAAEKGICVIATVRHEEQKKELLALKAEQVIVPEPGKLNQTINELTKGKGIKAALDAVGGPLATEVISSLSPGGRLIVYGLLDPEPASYFNAGVVFKNLVIKGFGVRGYVAGLSLEEKTQMISHLVHSIGRAEFQLAPSATYTADQFEQAFAYNKGGKILFEF